MRALSLRSLQVVFLVTILSAPSWAGDPPVEPNTRLRILGPTAELQTGAEFGTRVLLDTEVDGVQGWSFGVAHDAAVLELLGAESGELTAAINNGGPPQFLVIDTEPRGENVGVTMAVVISFTQPITVGIGNDYEILKMSYRVVADPTEVDPCEPIQTSVAISNEINEPPVNSVLTVDGETNTPEFVNADITVRCPGTLEISRCEGDTENVYLEWAFGGSPDWDFLFLYRDAELLASLEPDATSYTDEGLEPGDYAYTLVTFVVDDPAGPVLIFSHCIATVIPVTVESIEPTIAYFIGGESVTIRGTAFTSAETTTVSFFAEGEEPLLLEVVEVVSENELTALVPASPRLGSYHLRLENERGSAELLDAFDYGFVRSEVNADGVLDISDGIVILGYLFLGEGELICLDAADSTNDGQLDLSDAIRVFGFLFSGGPQPAAPYPDPGFDTGNDPFGCLDEVGA